jgi:ADP-dependent NAD(P)H-hydrate dehydratase / NAD(P)H-hydrate epimerase
LGLRAPTFDIRLIARCLAFVWIVRHDRGMLDWRRFPELLTPLEMGRADRLAVVGGAASINLMERAGAAVAFEASRMARSAGRILVVCGPGNNGGDGFIAARILRDWGYGVEVALLGALNALKGDAAEAARRWGGKVAPLAQADFSRADFIVDALFGAGLDRDISGEALGCVEAMNACGRPVLSVDVPSGLDGASGAARPVAVQASASVTFFRLKPGHLLEPGRALSGRLVLADIGIEGHVLTAIGAKAFANVPALWRGAFPRLRVDGHKYSRGAALTLSGNSHSTGAARLAARAALRAGAGLSTLVCRPDAVLINAAHVTAVMVAPFDGVAGFEKLLEDNRRNAILLGPGAGIGPGTKELVAAALTSGEARRAVVLDADALTSFALEAQTLAALIRRGQRDAIITPHEGEFARLFASTPTIAHTSDKLARARAAADFLGAVVLIKGPDTVVAEPGGRAAIGCDLPPTLATAGSGDVLAGFIAGLAAQGMPPFEAAACAVWLHGAAARAFGPGVIAEDLPEQLPAVFRTFDNSADAQK